MSKVLLDRLRLLLGVGEAEDDGSLDKLTATTPDGEFTIRTVACFGQCALEPVVEVDHQILGHVNERGAITGASLIVATGPNNLAINRSVQQVAERFVGGARLKEGALNRVNAVVRAYDPCLSCSTHAFGTRAFRLRLVNPAGQVLQEM